MKTLAVTGHRPNKLGGYAPCFTHELVKTALRFALEHAMPDRVLTGMALGVDQWMAEVCFDMQIPYIACVPFPGQELVWRDQSTRAHYARLLERAAGIVHVYQATPGTDRQRAAYLLDMRNRYMVERADVLVAVWDGTQGGTANCVRFARKMGVLVDRVHPRDIEHINNHVYQATVDRLQAAGGSL